MPASNNRRFAFALALLAAATVNAGVIPAVENGSPLNLAVGNGTATVMPNLKVPDVMSVPALSRDAPIKEGQPNAPLGLAKMLDEVTNTTSPAQSKLAGLENNNGMLAKPVKNALTSVDPNVNIDTGMPSLMNQRRQDVSGPDGNSTAIMDPLDAPSNSSMTTSDDQVLDIPPAPPVAPGDGSDNGDDGSYDNGDFTGDDSNDDGSPVQVFSRAHFTQPRQMTNDTMTGLDIPTPPAAPTGGDDDGNDNDFSGSGDDSNDDIDATSDSPLGALSARQMDGGVMNVTGQSIPAHQPIVESRLFKAADYNAQSSPSSSAMTLGGRDEPAMSGDGADEDKNKDGKHHRHHWHHKQDGDKEKEKHKGEHGHKGKMPMPGKNVTAIL